MAELNKEVQYIKGVGPNRVKLLNNLNIFTLKDLITYYPRDYEDRSKPKKIEDLVDGEEEDKREIRECDNIGHHSVDFPRDDNGFVVCDPVDEMDISVDPYVRCPIVYPGLESFVHYRRIGIHPLVADEPA